MYFQGRKGGGKRVIIKLAGFSILIFFNIRSGPKPLFFIFSSLISTSSDWFFPKKNIYINLRNYFCLLTRKDIFFILEYIYNIYRYIRSMYIHIYIYTYLANFPIKKFKKFKSYQRFSLYVNYYIYKYKYKYKYIQSCVFSVEQNTNTYEKKPEWN